MKTKKRNGLRPNWDRVLQPNSLQVQSQSSHILIANDNEWAIFTFRSKIGLKRSKNRVYCILRLPVGDQPPPPPPAAPDYATAFSCENRYLPFNSSTIALVFFFIDLRKKRGKLPILAAKTRPFECSFR